MPHLRCEIEQGFATIVLNNPPQNRLAPQMVDELCEILNLVGKSEARAVLLYAEGPDFSFGGDIVPWPAMSPRELRTLFADTSISERSGCAQQSRALSTESERNH